MSETNKGELDFDADFMRWHGRKPEGEYQHWCPDWDFLPIDDSCREFECCTCLKEQE